MPDDGVSFSGDDQGSVHVPPVLAAPGVPWDCPIGGSPFGNALPSRGIFKYIEFYCAAFAPEFMLPDDYERRCT